MISLSLEKKLLALKKAKKIPNFLLITGLYHQEIKAQRLVEIACYLEGSKVSEARGSVIFLGSQALNSIKVDEVRNLLKKLSLCNWDPSSGRYILVPKSELLTAQSSNALLKSLEETPKDTYFILGAPSKRSVLKTVLSRSFVINEDVGHLASKEKLNVFEEAFFTKDFKSLVKLSKKDIQEEWQEFSLKARENFIHKAYSGELNKNEWHRLFDFMDDLDEKIKANMDIKWLALAIQRFGFNG